MTLVLLMQRSSANSLVETWNILTTGSQACGKLFFPKLFQAFKVGDKVMACFLGMNPRQGVICSVNADGSLDVVYDHGAKEVRVSRNKISAII